MKTKKRILIDSWISALVCLIMIVGVTYAWFNTGTSVEADMVQVGEMAVELVDSEGTSMESKTLQWMTQNINYWEPGCTYYTEPFTVMNSGDLYFKYKLSIEGFTGDMELLDVLEFHIYKYDTTNNKVLTDKAYEGVEVQHKNLDAGATYVLGGTMSKNADNSYQGKKLRNATVVINATQIDSDNAYADVTLDNTGEIDFSKATQVATFSELKTAVASATAETPAIIVLTQNIDATSKITVNNPVQIYSFTNSTITLGVNDILFNVSEGASLYMEGVTLTSSLSTSTAFIRTRGDFEMRDCAVTDVVVKKGTTKYSLIEARKEANITLTNTTFSGNDCLYMIRDYDAKDQDAEHRAGTASTKIQYCTFTDNTTSWMFWIRSNYSILGGNISGNTNGNAVFRLNNVKTAKLTLQYATLRNNTTTGNQSAIAWVQSYATMNINEGTVIEGNTASRSYGNIKAGSKSILNINGGTIKAITINDKFTNETDNFTGIVNDKATVTISASAIVEGIHDRVDGYTIGSTWPAN